MRDETTAVPVKATLADSISGMLNVFVDPAATAKQVGKRGFWVLPLIVLCLVMIVFTVLQVPLMLHVSETNPSPNMTADQMQKALPAMKIGFYVFAAVIPMFVVLLMLLSAWLIGVACSVLGIQAKFHDLFSLLAACSMISVVQGIAGFIVVRMKADDLHSMEDFQPPFGLDIFFSGLKGPSLALLNFFSIFEVWYIVVLGLGLSYLARCSKGKAFMAITPAWLIPLLFRIVGSLFQRS